MFIGKGADGALAERHDAKIGRGWNIRVDRLVDFQRSQFFRWVGQSDHHRSTRRQERNIAALLGLDLAEEQVYVASVVGCGEQGFDGVVAPIVTGAAEIVFEASGPQLT